MAIGVTTIGTFDAVSEGRSTPSLRVVVEFAVGETLDAVRAEENFREVAATQKRQLPPDGIETGAAPAWDWRVS